MSAFFACKTRIKFYSLAKVALQVTKSAIVPKENCYKIAMKEKWVALNLKGYNLECIVNSLKALDAHAKHCMLIFLILCPMMHL